MSELGSLLVRAREARGLTLEDAERDTRISRRYLQALESEQFEVIPAPVYARGFLRSYSQYLGIDPQEALSLFPREDDAEYGEPVAPRTASAPARPTRQQPISAVGASRPTWRQPQPPSRQPGRPAPGGRAPGAYQRQQPTLPLEPMIGVDIGVPKPTNRVKTDPAAQTRSLVIAVVAVGAIVAVVLIAFLISNLGGESTPPGSTSSNSGTVRNPTPLPTQAGQLPPSGLQTTQGVVPAVEGKTAIIARAAIQEAGFVAVEKTQKSNAPKGTVITQSPAADVAWRAGDNVIIVVSEGP
ncbi:MAG: hypothetical protein C0506_00910 [Anaerolinea sp.]|nr:hypothetical protein [Anaerolinea sp.]